MYYIFYSFYRFFYRWIGGILDLHVIIPLEHDIQLGGNTLGHVPTDCNVVCILDVGVL